MSKIKADTWKTILQIAISFLTAIATSLGMSSCMG
ncbi:smalltalk protein [Prevotellaceae bacterium LCP21S3_C11]|nr:smalltalk protein [Segatella hominis]WOZ82764.1 smalltalk protein [Segatella hominis]